MPLTFTLKCEVLPRVHGGIYPCGLCHATSMHQEFDGLFPKVGETHGEGSWEILERDSTLKAT